MDTFITVISWLAGFYALFILALAIGFSAAGHANTGNSELGIVSIGSTLLFLFLIYLGASSLFSTDDVKVPNQIKSERNVSVEHVQNSTTVEVQNSQNDNIILWIFYIFMFLPVPLIVVVFYKKLKES